MERSPNKVGEIDAKIRRVGVDVRKVVAGVKRILREAAMHAGVASRARQVVFGAFAGHGWKK